MFFGLHNHLKDKKSYESSTSEYIDLCIFPMIPCLNYPFCTTFLPLTKSILYLKLTRCRVLPYSILTFLKSSFEVNLFVVPFSGTGSALLIFFVIFLFQMLFFNYFDVLILSTWKVPQSSFKRHTTKHSSHHFD